MITIKKQYHGIKFPFTVNNNKGFFIDLDRDAKKGVLSKILHVILTQRGTRIRKPDFGTNLYKYLFDMSDDITWENVQNEIIESVGNYVVGAKINNVNIVKDENDDNKLYLDIEYSVTDGYNSENNEVKIEL